MSPCDCCRDGLADDRDCPETDPGESEVSTVGSGVCPAESADGRGEHLVSPDESAGDRVWPGGDQTDGQDASVV